MCLGIFMMPLRPLHEQVGDFGELVYAGMDWVDPKLARRSMELGDGGDAARQQGDR